MGANVTGGLPANNLVVWIDDIGELDYKFFVFDDNAHNEWSAQPGAIWFEATAGGLRVVKNG